MTGTRGLNNGLAVHWEMWGLRKGGMPALDVLRTATTHAAKKLGLERELGSVAPGKLADLLILDNNPIQDIKVTRNIRYVMRGGRLYTGVSLAQVWPEERPNLPVRDLAYDGIELAVMLDEQRQELKSPRKIVEPVPLENRVRVSATSKDKPAAPSNLLNPPSKRVAYKNTDWVAENRDFDLSPDGRTLIFDYVGEIFTLPVTGGEARQLTHTLAVEKSPTWSPDGKQIAFSSDASGRQEIWVMNADGSHARQVTPERPLLPYQFGRNYDSLAQWTSDGQTLLTGNHLIDVSDGRTVGYLDWLDNQGQSVLTPDRRHIITGSYLGQRGLHLHDLQTGKAEQIPTDPNAAYILPTMSPDGKWLAYFVAKGAYSKVALVLMNLTNGEKRIIALYRFSSHCFAFTPDSQALILFRENKVRRVGIYDNKDQAYEVTVQPKIDFAKLVHHTLRVDNGPMMNVRYIRWPMVSPDKKEMVFGALRRVYRMKLSNGKPERLVDQGGLGQFQPVYSVDGQWIAYVTWKDGEGGDVWKIPANGGKPIKLTTISGYYSYPTWSPDGKKVAVIKKGPKLASWELGARSNTGILQLLPSDGGEARSIIGRVYDSSMSFSADGKRIMQLRDDTTPRMMPELKAANDWNARYKLKAHTWPENYPTFMVGDIDLESSNNVWRTVAYTNFPAAVGGADCNQMLPSPDGRYIVYACNYHGELFLAPLNTEKGAMPLYRTMGHGPLVRLAIGMDPSWDADGKMLTWVVGARIYRARPEDLLAEGERMLRRPQPPLSLAEPIRYSPPIVIPEPYTDIDLKVPRSLPRGTLVLKDVRAITMKGDEVIENATLVVTNDRITAIGPSGSVKIPPSATVLSLQGKTIVPGFIDMHTHASHGSLLIPPFFKEEMYFKVNLAFGVTSMREVAGGVSYFDPAERVETGDIVGARLFHDGFHPSCGTHGIESLEDARAFVNGLKLMGATVIKAYEPCDRRWDQWMIRASDEAGLNVTGHPYYSRTLDGMTGQEHQMGYGDGDETIVAASGAWWTTTMIPVTYFASQDSTLYRNQKLLRFWKNQNARRLREILESGDSGIAGTGWYDDAKRAAKVTHAGGNVTPGSHGDSPGIGLHWEIWAYQIGGMTPMEAMRAATIKSAEGLGAQRDLGSLEVGKIADLMVLDKNPLQNIRNTLSIRYVMKNGFLYDDETLDQVWPSVKKTGLH